MNKREAVLDCLKADNKLMDMPASAIVNTVKKRHGKDVSETYASTLRKEYSEMPTTPMPGQNGPVAPATPPAAIMPMTPPTAPAQPQDLTVIDFKTVEPTIDLMLEVSTLALKCGGMDNLVTLATKMKDSLHRIAAGCK